jgi:hypothetical protein
MRTSEPTRARETRERGRDEGGRVVERIVERVVERVVARHRDGAGGGREASSDDGGRDCWHPEGLSTRDAARRDARASPSRVGCLL